jgi:UDP-N-acetylmuramoylalanine--D-glutamate ligase
MEQADPGDVILFSPAFASFGLFKNEYERNDEFLKIISNL